MTRKNNDYKKLIKRRKTWRKKLILKKVYFEWYLKIKKYLKKGKTLEIGSGIGNYEKFNKKIVTSDIIKAPWIDYCFPGEKIPFKKNSFNNIVLIDVFHHLKNPVKFLHEAYRVLKKNGRIIMVEPYPSPFSLIIYGKFHPEPFIMNIDYFKKADKNLPIPNQAIPYLFFFEQFDKFKNIFGKKFKIIKREKFSFLLYPLSGGFQNKQLIPNFCVSIFKLIEYSLKPLKDLLSFRCFIVLQKIEKNKY